MMAFDSKVFGQRIKFFLTARGMSQQDLADKCGQHVESINAYANGATVPGIDKVYRIAEALETTPNVLCGWSELPQIDLADLMGA